MCVPSLTIRRSSIAKAASGFWSINSARLKCSITKRLFSKATVEVGGNTLDPNSERTSSRWLSLSSAAGVAANVSTITEL